MGIPVIVFLRSFITYLGWDFFGGAVFTGVVQLHPCSYYIISEPNKLGFMKLSLDGVISLDCY